MFILLEVLHRRGYDPSVMSAYSLDVGVFGCCHPSAVLYVVPTVYPQTALLPTDRGSDTKLNPLYLMIELFRQYSGTGQY